MQQFLNLQNKPSLETYTQSLRQAIAYGDINCVRIGRVVSFNSENCTASVQIAQKFITGYTDSGVPITKDFSPITAKVFFNGSSTKGMTYPLNEGDEGILLFNDRELESWYLQADDLAPKYLRAHALTDAIFLCGMHSLLNLPSYMDNCLNFWYNNSRVTISDDGVHVTGNLTVDGSITATGDIVAGGISLMTHVHGNGNEGQDTTAPKG